MINLINKIFPSSVIDKTNKEIRSLGLNSKIKAEYFLLTRLVIEITLFIILILIPRYGVLLALGVIVFFHLLYKDLLITAKILKRSKVLSKDALEYFMLLNLLLDKCSDLGNALIKVSESVSNDLSLEVNYCMKDLRRKNLHYCLENLRLRIPNQDLRDIFLELEMAKDKETQHNLLNNYLKVLEEKKDLRLQNRLSKIPIQMIFSVIIFLSVILLLLIVMPKYLV